MAKARKSKAKKPGKKKAKKPAKRAAAKSRKAPAKAKKSAPRKAKKAAPVKARQAAPKKKKQIVGEGDYAAAKAFDKDQTNFVKRNKAKIPEMGKQAEQALEGREGPSLIAAEQEAMSRSTID
jgi:hypothetical protein